MNNAGHSLILLTKFAISRSSKVTPVLDWNYLSTNGKTAWKKNYGNPVFVLANYLIKFRSVLNGLSTITPFTFVG